ncbi:MULTISPECIES: hypothetical protein [Burkholderia]|uniref:Uncharacterized protein n=1 Tax=Burkholderia savannae TaxID=1637837 RepID=A0ABR5TMA2_9BURK|nr:MULTISPECIES: hypothetical protein [Burkholderia]AOJ70932.1 hypothetical protein WS78_15375 [Burkholderia savannae]AOJ82709.1 hypothetical protein WS86_16025 [Burkholderia savannae]AOK48865.1 hypothetical protein WT60_15585 [Burkholderia sp. MSMB617WGS]KGS07699.1 hypothetical protein X946_2094 [Burkholderia sp. ABCPW 111]KVG44056.1 hypothetical protein WS77_10715 [Burkholderia sp. MSMB0265]
MSSSDIIEPRRVLVSVTSATATFTALSPHTPGFLHIVAEGAAPLNVGNIHLVHDPGFIGGVLLEVAGIAGRPSPTVKKYRTPTCSFESQYHKEIFIRGANGIIPVRVGLFRHEAVSAAAATLDAE